MAHLLSIYAAQAKAAWRIMLDANHTEFMNMRHEVEFPSEGRGWLYRPRTDEEKLPAIVMAHGLTAVREQYLDRYTEVFAERPIYCAVQAHPQSSMRLVPGAFP